MKDRKFTFDSENLAFPEIHTGKVKHKHKKQKKDNE